MTDAVLARKMWRTLEPYHGMIYFSPRASEAYAALGIEGQRGYFASRAAAMGAVPAEMVIATFYNFHPALVAAAIPAAWDIASPSAILDARMAAADAQLRDLLGDTVLDSEEMAEAAALAHEAAAACPLEGRPLFAGHASLEWPEAPHLVLWHAVTLLREFRGDTHIAALLLEGLDGCEALVTYGAAGGSLVPGNLLKATRGWPDDEWDAAVDRLRGRGLIDGEGRSTATGEAVRERIEQRTDEGSLAPYRAIGRARSDRLRALVRPFSRAIADSGIFLGGLS